MESKKNKNNIFFSIIIALLIVCLAVLCVIFIKSTNTSEKASKQTLASYSEEIEKAKQNESKLREELDKANQEKSRLESENGVLQGEKDALQKENGELKKQAAELAAKKKAEAEAAAKARTDEIVRRLSLPLAEQQAIMPNVCYLTFDDGPSNNTISILNTLSAYNVKATFFVTNTGITNYIKNIYDAGHAVGLHTSSHNYKTVYSSVEAYLTDLEAISNSVLSLTGQKSQIVRFPGGGSNTVSRKYCAGIMTELSNLLPQMGYSYYDWNVSSGDAVGGKAAASTIVNNVLSGANGKNSICVLMHDSAAKTTTAEALPAIIEGLAERGFRFEVITPGTYGYHQHIAN